MQRYLREEETEMLIKVTDQERRPIPHEPGQWMDLRRLDLTQFKRAKEAHESTELKSLARRVEMLGADAMSGLARVYASAGTKDSRTEYDLIVLLTSAIVGWSYDEAVSGDTIGQLDEKTAQWAYDEILIMNGHESDVVRKNVSSGSTATSTESRESSPERTG